MRVYFLSCIPAILKLNGMYIGVIDGFERHIELDKKDRIFAEIIPDKNLHGINFFLDEKFFSSPPPACDIYSMEGDYLIYVREYSAKDCKLDVLFQTRFCGNLITLFAQGGVYLSIEGMEYTLEPLPLSFAHPKTDGHTLAGREVLSLSNGKHLILINEQGKIIFKNSANTFTIANTLKITSQFETCACIQAECEYSYDGEKLTLISAKTVEMRPPEREIAHFAFFESVLTGADSTKYLDDDLKGRANEIHGYLGEFVSVTVPTELFYRVHGNINAVGLVYPKGKNIFDIKYYAVDFTDDKISNIYTVE